MCDFPNFGRRNSHVPRQRAGSDIQVIFLRWASMHQLPPLTKKNKTQPILFTLQFSRLLQPGMLRFSRTS